MDDLPSLRFKKLQLQRVYINIQILQGIYNYHVGVHLLFDLLSVFGHVLTSFITCRGWLSYALPCTFLFLALYMLWHKFFRKGKQLEALLIKPPPNKNAVEQIVTLQNAISRLENCVHAGNITLLKLRAVLFAAVPKVLAKCC